MADNLNTYQSNNGGVDNPLIASNLNEENRNPYVSQFSCLYSRNIVGNKEYNKDEFSGLGRINIEKHIVDGKNILTQSDFYATNTIYNIQYDFDLNSQSITIPSGCCLNIEGGSISNGTLVGQDTYLIYSRNMEDVFIDVTLEGTFIEKSGSGDVSSVNGKTGVVVLDAEDVGAYPMPLNGIPMSDLSEEVQEMIESGGSGSTETFIIDIAKYGITEGQMTKDGEGHYSSEQYTTMYNNMLGFNQAFKDARDVNASKIIIPKGIYCFTPSAVSAKSTSGSNSHSEQILQIYNTNNIVFDFSGSTFKLCLDSTQRSQYNTYNPNTVYATYARLLNIVASTNIVVENLIAIGDRCERSYTESGEKNQQDTRGVCIGVLYDNIEIRNCDLSGFMATCIGTSGYEISPELTVNLNTNRKSPGTFTNYGYYYTYNGWTVSKVNSSSTEFYTISELVDCSTIYTTVFKETSSRVREVADNKIYALWHNSGYSHSIDCARYVDILTYETDNQETPSRIIEVEQLSNFQLEGNERYIRVQCHDEIDTPNPVEGEAFSTTTHKMLIRYAQGGRIIIRNNYLHDNFLGGVSGNEGEMLICDNLFKKTYTEDPPAYLTEGTNFHFDGEDTNGELYTFLRNKFISLGGIGKLLFPYSPKRLFFKDNHCDEGIAIGRHFEVYISDNYFGGGIHIGEFIGENGEYNINGGRTLRRKIEVCGNVMQSIGFSGTFLTDAKIYNNRLEVETMLNIGILASLYNGQLYDNIDFSNNTIVIRKLGSVAINPFVGKNNTIIADLLKNLGLPNWEDTKFTVNAIEPYTNSYFNKPLIFKNLTISKYLVTSYCSVYSDIEFINCTFNAPLWYCPDIKSDCVIIFRNCIFNDKLSTINTNAIKISDGTCKIIFIGCTFNVDSLTTRFRSSFDVKVEAIDCTAGIKQDTTSYQALLTSDNVVAAYNKTLVSPSSGTSAERPNFPSLHYQYFDTTLNKPVYASEIDSTTGDVTWLVVEYSTNKVTTISSASTDIEYPSAKAVWDMIGDVESLLAAI